MRLLNTNYRVKKYPKGFVVEQKVYKGFLRGYKWEFAMTPYGIDNEPWYYSNIELAISEATKEFKWGLIDNSYK